MRRRPPPISPAAGRAGLVSGPRMLNAVGMPISRRGAAVYLKAGWKTGAKQKPMPTSARHCWTPAGVRSIATPSSSSTSAVPHLDEAARLPCLTTGTPDAATTMDAIVEMFTPVRSPPVPTMPTARWRVCWRRRQHGIRQTGTGGVSLARSATMVPR